MQEEINLNTAGVEELAKLIGKERAETIVEYRDEHGPFQGWEDLEEIPGFSPEVIENLEKGGVAL